tara:strand:+ start:5961 stop:7145 length:1185 start_codon:yes stop_codon:yes gene_type:complete
MFIQDYLTVNGGGQLQASKGGEVAQALQGCHFDPGYMRPYRDENGIPSVVVNSGKTKWNTKTGAYDPIYEKRHISDEIAKGLPLMDVFNATSLRKDEWVKLDQVVVQAARERLSAWSDLASKNPITGFDGMSTMVLEQETQSDPGAALVDMDGLSEGSNDSPRNQLEGLPLPITHAGFTFSQRRLAVSANRGTPLNLTNAANAARRVAEQVEKTTIGVATGLTYGDATEYGRSPTVYGYTNFPDRVTKTDMTTPTGANGNTVYNDWLALRDLMYDNNFYGPFMAYVSTDWTQFLDSKFSSAEPSAGTLRSNLKEIDGIQDIKRLDFLSNAAKFHVILVQMTSNVAQAVIGMPLRTIQWPSKGGMQQNFKVMCIHAPRLQADFDGNCGIGHGTIA